MCNSRFAHTTPLTSYTYSSSHSIPNLYQKENLEKGIWWLVFKTWHHCAKSKNNDFGDSFVYRLISSRLTSWHGLAFRITDLLWGNPPVTDGVSGNVSSLLLSLISCWRNKRVACDTKTLNGHHFDDSTKYRELVCWTTNIEILK